MILNIFKIDKFYNRSSLEDVLKSFYFHFNILIAIIISVHMVIFHLDGNKNISYFMLGVFLFMLIVSAVTYQVDYHLIKFLVNYYIVVTLLILTLLVFVFWKYAPETILYFILLPLGLYNIYNFKTLLKLMIIILLIIFSIIFIPLSYFPNFIHNHNIRLSNLKVLYTFLPIALFLIFYNIKIAEKKYSLLIENSLDNKKDSYEKRDNAEENQEMFNEIFNRIKEYLESETPWKNPEFGIQDLAYEFGINTTYLSKAISQNSDTNFKNLINTYRINYIKDEMKVNYPKYTLMHIYISAGFKHQSTFNRAFKQIENKTPSEYMRSIGIDAYAISE